MFSIDNMSRQPVYEQLIKQTEDFILRGILKPGEKMPSVRNLSFSLNINPNTIQKAYSELDTYGLIYSVPGRGCFVSEDAIERISDKKRKSLTELKDMLRDFKLAGIDLDEIKHIAEEVYKEGDPK